MDLRARLSTERRALQDAVLEGNLDPSQQARLRELLLGDAEFRRAYVEHLSTVASIRHYLTGRGSSRVGLGPLPPPASPIVAPPSVSTQTVSAPIAPAQSSSSSNPRLPGLLGLPGLLNGAFGGFQRSADFAMRPMSLLLIVATCSLGALLVLLPMSRNSERADSAGSAARSNSADASADGPSQFARPDAFVARIVQVSPDVLWGEPSVALDFCLRARPGDKINVVAGLVEIEFFSGAKIILHGPSVFTPTGPMAGRLESGRLTGEVSNGNFRLMTPTAEVIDLGTEFGVVADATVGTDVVVFNGRVQVVSRPDGAGSEEVLDMTEGMAARFRSDGTTEFGVKTEAGQFARDVGPSNTSAGAKVGRDEVCLIDILSGGDGLGKGLPGAVDPSSGLRDYGEHGRKLADLGRWGDGAFHAVAWHPMVDGVFVPSPDGQQVQIDSLGHKVDLPANRGATHGSIWARRRESALEPNSDIDNDFWGWRTLRGIVERLMASRSGLVGMHANAGMTFDLRTLRMVHRRSPQEFRATVVNAENSRDWSPSEIPEYKRTVDFRVYVDGVLRFARLSFRREDGDGEFAIALSPGDRFLTVVVTDDGNMEFDHVLLVDPVISLDKK